MNQLFIIFCIVSILAAIASYKKLGLWRSIVIAFVLPILLFVIAVIMLIVGGDR